MTLLVVDPSVARRLGPVAGPVIVVPRGRGRRRGEGGWRPLRHDEVLDALVDAPSGAIVLARPPCADPGGAALAAVAGLLELPVVRLPEGIDAAAWILGVAAAWAVADEPDVLRRLQALVGTAGDAPPPTLPRRAWGAGGAEVPGLRPGTLARWTRRAWCPCGWCDGGGGLAGHACARCGAPIAAWPGVGRGLR
ncbi:MAG: hypothetical protein QOD86_305 [Miltoncostaeaceae bacterium]|jgi:hypothetical protein|nr:hypothetical protein [Miltoncostaeaceae bacterium]